MEKEPKWKQKSRTAKCHEGYAGVAYEDVWGLDLTLSRIISAHLRAFLKAEKGPNAGTPGFLAEEFGCDNGYKKWLEFIRKMIYAFEEYQRVDNKYNIEPEKEARIREGMQLFIDYFKYLWI